MSASSSDDLLIARLLALPEGERAIALERACLEQPALRDRLPAIRAGLASAKDDARGSSSGRPSPAAMAQALKSALDVPLPEAPGTRIGPYKLLQEIGRGGFGVVWMAEQDHPIRRRVALKIIKAGMDTTEVIARFEAERQALALMDHPNIAHVFDAGATDTGRPYFAMELVRGVAITRYCDETRLPAEARLQLFMSVCQAVQHAHQKGVIHRDLKPSNILVTLHDGAPVPKVIDFGIAKATGGARLTDKTLFTQFHAFIGTPAYTSPEQMEMSGIDIDTRSDVYSLGVLLYELLTGRPPFDPKALLKAGLDEIRRIIREVDPPKPSTNLSTFTAADRVAVAKLRGTDPARLSLLLRGDLDWIVMRCLEKDRTRRYATANGLAADILRHLQNEPVVARPPGNFYRTGKFIRRHRFAFGAIVAVALVLIAGTVISTWQAVRATRAEHTADRERTRADDLLTYMIGDLSGELGKVGRLDVLESVGDKALAYFASLSPAELTDDMLARHAKVLLQIGDIRRNQRRYTEAAAAFGEAYTRAEALAARHPQNGEMLFARSQAEYWNGTANLDRGELSAARDWFTRYRNTCAALVASGPSNPAWQSEFAYAQEGLASVEKEQGNLGTARTGFVAALATLENLLAPNPADQELRYAISTVHSWLGEVAELQGDFPEALKQYMAQAARATQLQQAEPRNETWRLKLAEALFFQTNILLITGRFASADERARDPRRLIEELVHKDPSNRHWQAVELCARLQEAKLTRQRGDGPAAGRLLDDCRHRLEELVAAEPTDPSLTSTLGVAWRIEAEVRLAAGRADAAAAASRALELGGSALRRGRPADSEVGNFALACIVAGEIAAQADDDAAARGHWQRAEEALDPRLPGTHYWRLLDPAARAAALLGRTTEARALIAQLDSLGYIPVDPWPEAAKSSVPPTAKKNETHQ